MQYFWDIEELINIKYKLIEMLKDKKINTTKKYLIESDLETLNDMIKNKTIEEETKENKKIKRTNFKKACINISNNIITDFQRDLMRSIMPLSEDIAILNHDDINEDVFYSTFFLEDQIELFFKNFPSNSKQKRLNKDLFNPENHLLQLETIEDQNKTFPIFNGKTYLSVYDPDNIKGFINLCHELGHYNQDALTNRMDKRMIACDSKIFNYQEVMSIFYELLSSYFLIENNIITEKEGIICFRDSLHNNLLNTYDWLIFDEVKCNNKVKLSDKKNLFKTYYDMFYIMEYNISYIIAVNLFEEYIINKNSAIEKLNYIINNITGKNDKKIFKDCDITPDNTKSFEKHIKRMKNN